MLCITKTKHPTEAKLKTIFTILQILKKANDQINANNNDNLET